MNNNYSVDYNIENTASNFTNCNGNNNRDGNENNLRNIIICINIVFVRVTRFNK
jgi:hypothetical protein